MREFSFSAVRAKQNIKNSQNRGITFHASLLHKPTRWSSLERAEGRKIKDQSKPKKMHKREKTFHVLEVSQL